MTQIKIFGTHEENTLKNFEYSTRNALAAVLCADGHVGKGDGSICVGTAIALDNAVSLNAIGPDACCGNKAIRTNITLDMLTADKIHVSEIAGDPRRLRSDVNLTRIANEIQRNISFGTGRKNTADDAPVDHPLFDDPAWSIFPENLRNSLMKNARDNLGSVGSSNHFVNVFVDKADNHIWIGCHFGSRGFGYITMSKFLALAHGGTWNDNGKEQETILDLSTPLGSDYWQVLGIARQLAFGGRDWVCSKVLGMLGGEMIDEVHNNHNDANEEMHWIDGRVQKVIVTRKGSTPCWPEMRSFVGGSMADDSVILKGRNGITPDDFDLENITNSVDGDSNYLQIEALFSTVHGAGRLLSRTAAMGKKNRKTGKLKRDGAGNIIQPPLVTQEMMNETLAKKGVILRGGGVDESSFCYRPLQEVLKAQGSTIEVTNILVPVISVMASDRDYDPYRGG